MLGTTRRAFMALSVAGSGLSARADAPWPSRAVTLLVPWAAGGSTDAVARVLAARLASDLGRPFPVENRGGANGTIGFAAAARAAADGYTVLVGTISTYAMAPALYNLPYDTARDFVGAGLIAAQPIVLVVPRASPARTLDDLLALARRPGHSLTYANSGTGSSTHLATELFLDAARLDVPDVGYRGGAPAVQATLAGEVAFVMQAASGVLPLVRSGDLRALAITSRSRSPLAPDIPTFAEQGLQAIDVQEHVGLLLPAGTPRDIVDRLHGEARAALEAAPVTERLAALGVTVDVQRPEEWPTYLAHEMARWHAIIRSRGIRLI